MENVKTVGIIGAGLSGLVTAKTCLEYGFEVKIFEKDTEPGGVWSSSRRYPGLTTQNTKDTYFFSDFPMPDHYDEWPTGEQMQEYLTQYATTFNILPHIRFAHEITTLDFHNNTWTLYGKINGVQTFTEQVDFTVVCNGTFSDPYIPQIPGMDSFVSAGGKILHSTQYHSIELSRNKRTIVVGYCKSSADVSTAAADTAESTYLVYREAKWKMPRFIKGVNAKFMFLNRLGEALIKPDQHNTVEKIIHRLGMSKRMLGTMEKYISYKQKLDKLGLRPACGIKDQVFGEITMETPGFFDRVEQGKIIPKQGEIANFEGKNAILTSGEKIGCDVVIFATGFNQTLPFVPEQYLKECFDEQGNYILYRHILPPCIPSLAFVGYNSSLYCSLTSEIAALWVCEYLKRRVHQPGKEEIIREGKSFIQWRSSYRAKGSSRGLNLGPGSLQHVDRLLKDMHVSLPLHSLIPDWLITINPARYKAVKQKVMRRTLGKIPDLSQRMRTTHHKQVETTA